MSDFIVSARKYRPADFASVVGQEHITSTLKNAISRGQLAHAYLFCGPRGVGKTTCARIFAKAINCSDPQGSEACGECESCRSFGEGRSFSIHELDAASNNSVDDIRTLTEQVRVPPQVGRYSVYIIDEVHMLSQAAFNAFLKTLEEPPAHAIFILATTEKHKIIPTILSRCQIYDFNRIRVEDAVGYLKYIAGKEGVAFDDESLNLIAQKADGGMRDALSMFDKAVAFCGSKLDFREVARTLNVLDYDTYFTVTDFAARGDYRGALLLFDEVLRSGFSGQTFTAGLNAHFRDLLMCKDPSTAPLLEITGSLLERYKRQSAELDVGFLFDAIALMSSVESTLKAATNQRLHIELGLMKLCGLGQKKNNLEPSAPSLPPLQGSESKAPTPVTASISPETQAQTRGHGQESKPAAAPVGSSVNTPIASPVGDPASVSATAAPVATSAAPEVPTPASTTPPIATAKRNKSLSGVSISGALSGRGGKPEQAPEDAKPESAEGYEPDCEGKIEAAREKFLDVLRQRRPRFATALATMTVSGNKILATVTTDLLRDDIIQHQKELAALLREVSGTESIIVFEIDVREDKGAVRPIKPEDKLAHLRARNPLLDRLRKDLSLEIE